MSKKNTLIKNASILMIASIISRIIGLIYRRPLGAVLGSVGLGYYGYASNLYSILLLISSYSIPMAVSKIVSERLALKQYKNAHKVFKGALLYAVLVGGVTALVAFFGGGILLPANQQNAVPALQVLAPTIFLSAILGVFRGHGCCRLWSHGRYAGNRCGRSDGAFIHAVCVRSEPSGFRKADGKGQA